MDYYSLLGTLVSFAFTLTVLLWTISWALVSIGSTLGKAFKRKRKDQALEVIQDWIRATKKTSRARRTLLLRLEADIRKGQSTASLSEIMIWTTNKGVKVPPGGSVTFHSEETRK